MMGPEVLVPLGSFIMITTIVVSVLRYRERSRSHSLGADPVALEITTRLDRMEQAIDAIAVEVERVTEGQRFVTKLMVDRAREPGALTAPQPPSHNS